MHANRTKAILIAAFLGLLPMTTVLAGEPEKKVRVDQENLVKLSPEDQQHALAVADRLETILNTDRSTLTPEERKALRSETRDLKREVTAINRAGGTVIYISGAGLLLIIILILILT